MQQRVRLAHAIDRRASDDLEVHAAVEADGLVVLLVHVKRSRTQRLDGVGEQLAPNTLSAPVRMDEKRLYFVSTDRHEADDLTMYITHTDQRLTLWQPLAHERLEDLNVCLSHEKMRGARRCLPDLHHTRIIFWLHR